MVALFTIIPLLQEFEINVFRENATIFVFASSMIYMVYLGWSAFASYPDTECNTLYDSKAALVMQIIAGVIFTFATIWNIATASVQ